MSIRTHLYALLLLCLFVTGCFRMSGKNGGLNPLERKGDNPPGSTNGSGLPGGNSGVPSANVGNATGYDATGGVIPYLNGAPAYGEEYVYAYPGNECVGNAPNTPSAKGVFTLVNNLPALALTNLCTNEVMYMEPMALRLSQFDSDNFAIAGSMFHRMPKGFSGPIFPRSYCKSAETRLKGFDVAVVTEFGDQVVTRASVYSSSSTDSITALPQYLSGPFDVSISTPTSPNRAIFSADAFTLTVFPGQPGPIAGVAPSTVDTVVNGQSYSASAGCMLAGPNGPFKTSYRVPQEYFMKFSSSVTDAAATMADMTTQYGITFESAPPEGIDGGGKMVSRIWLPVQVHIPDAVWKVAAADSRVASLQPDIVIVLPTFPPESYRDLSQTQVVPANLSRIGISSPPTATPNVTVAIIDTGVEQHADLNVVYSKSFVSTELSLPDLNGHGTHIAGTIGALNNGYGVVGIAPGARIISLKAFDQSGNGRLGDVLNALNYVLTTGIARVVNLSYEIPRSGALDDMIAALSAQGILVVVAAGNDGVDAGNFSPAASPGAITVGAIVDTDGLPGSFGPPTIFGLDDHFATFSNRGNVLFMVAPGFHNLSTWIGGTYREMSGTSTATAHVTGAIARYLSQNPSATLDQVKNFLLQASKENVAGIFNERTYPMLNIGGLP